MTYSNDNMTGSIEMNHGSETADAVNAWFLAMAMPVPQRDEYTLTNDDGYLVFLNRLACVIRVTDREEAFDLDDKYALHPLLRKQTGNCVTDINPGIICPASRAAFLHLSARCHADNRRFDENILMNAGVLPGVIDDAGHAIAVIIDPGGMRRLNQSVDDTEKLLDKTGRPPSAQDVLYGPVRDLFHQAWPENTVAPDRVRLNAAWKECHRMRVAGQLVSGWLDDPWMQETNYKNVEGGTLYAARWPGPA